MKRMTSTSQGRGQSLQQRFEERLYGNLERQQSIIQRFEQRREVIRLLRERVQNQFDERLKVAEENGSSENVLDRIRDRLQNRIGAIQERENRLQERLEDRLDNLQESEARIREQFEELTGEQLVPIGDTSVLALEFSDVNLPDTIDFGDTLRRYGR